MNFGDLIIYIASFFGLFTTFYFFLTLYERKSELFFGECTTHPKVTICVPCYNEESTVVKTLQSLCALRYPKKQLEIIVVDDGSRDHTYAKAKAYAKKKNDHDIKVYKKQNGGKYTALNLAIKKAKGEIFGALDADSFVDKNALSRIVRVFEINKDVTAVTPSMLVHQPKGILQHIQYSEYLMGVFLRKVFAGLGSIHVTPGPFSFYRMTFLKEQNGFRFAHHTEDIELALRAQREHKIIENAVDAYVYTISPKNFKVLWKQRLRWYYGFLKNLSDYKDLFSLKHGNLGIFLLPSSIFSVFLTLTLLGYVTYTFIETFTLRILNWIAINFNFFELQWVNMDPFYFNTSPASLLGYIGLFISITVFIIAKKLSGEKRSIIFSYLVFILFYPILYPLWWLAALWCIITGKGVKWWHKSDVGKTTT